MIEIDRLDHLVLTVRDIATTCAWYERVLGMHVVRFGADRTALSFGQHKINLHEAGREWEPKAQQPTPGSADLCLIVRTPIVDVMRQLQTLGVPIEEGPVQRTGATHMLTSVYVRDPDSNLIELANIVETP